MTTEHPITPCGELHAGTAGAATRALLVDARDTLCSFAAAPYVMDLISRLDDWLANPANSGQQGRMQVAGASGSDDPNGDVKGDAS